jgi:hypothetical protein
MKSHYPLTVPQAVAVIVAVIVLSLLCTGCATSDVSGWRSSMRASGSETHQYNMYRLDAEVEHASRPLVYFEASPEALQVLAASGKPLILTVNNPYLMLSDPKAPWWERLIPSGDTLLWGGITLYQFDRANKLQSRQLDASTARDRVLIDAAVKPPLIINGTTD